MAPIRIQFQETPNPNAVKCVLEMRIPDLADSRGPRSYSSAQAAAHDPLGRPLFEIRGVTNILISDRWIAVNREPGVDWKPIKQAVERVVRSHVQSSA